jgi:hypothetical protein
MIEWPICSCVREAFGEIMAIPADHVDGSVLPMSKEPKAVVLDPMHPAGACRRLFCWAP